MTTYYNELMVVWQLDLFTVEEWESNKDIARYKKAKEHSRVFVSLAGLNRDLDEVRVAYLAATLCPLFERFFLKYVNRHVVIFLSSHCEFQD